MGKKSIYTDASLKASEAIIEARKAISKMFVKDPPFMTENVRGRKEKENAKIPELPYY